MTVMTKTHLLKDNLSVVKARKVRAILENQHPKLDVLLEKLDHIISQPITIAVMGEFSAGKSSFLNRLLDIDTLPVSVLPKTATLTRLVYGVEPSIEIEYHFNNTVIKHLGYDVFTELQRAAKINTPLFQQELEGIREIRVFINNPILNRFHLLDTPGFNHDDAMDEKSLISLESADIVFWLADYNQLGKKTEFEKLALLKEKSPIYLIVNKGDVHVSGREAYQNTVKDISDTLLENSFINFFHSNEIFLISSKVTDQFWDGIFQQFLARIGELFLNADLQVSLDLIVDQSNQIKKALEVELTLYSQLQQRILLFKQENSLEYIIIKENKELKNQINDSLFHLRESLHRHYKKCANLNTDAIFSANMFAAEYLIQDLYIKFTTLQNNYSAYFTHWEQTYHDDLVVALKEFLTLLPDHYSSLHERIHKIIAYYELKNESLKIKAYYLPATDRTIKLLDQVGIRQFNAKSALTANLQRLNWKLEFHVLSDGILNLNESSKGMPFSRYVQLAIDDSLSEDYLSDLNHIVKNNIITDVFSDINLICIKANQQITSALTILGES